MQFPYKKNQGSLEKYLLSNMGQEIEERYRIMISHQKTGRSSKFTLQKDQLEESSLPRVCSLSIIKDNTTVDCGEGDGTPLQDSCLGNPMDGGGWRAAVHGVAKSRTRLSDFTFTFHFHALEKEMATHSSVPAWRIPGMGEPGGLLSLSRTESDTTEVT